ncbi:uracil-DNA glycosylase [Sulfurimonas sp.]|uniref:uracil-DNA glycosylase n=1 Tax=Sulfurimonas sp. TaxID=2022749 RepID=UPI002AB09A15|nr:uracil-DNA glycosylase [Sulfurimonas sp.]
MKRINCRICIHYFVTWEKDKPHGCKAYGFKAQQIPSIVVFQSSGSDCNLFRAKPLAK